MVYAMASESHFRRQYFHREDIERNIARLERYLKTLEDVGQIIEKHHGRFYGGRSHKVARVATETMRVMAIIKYLKSKIPKSSVGGNPL
ncbi:hypothetical protein A2841_02820 [Candidatus Kaiserbacteria bacterium RIFCSPHIGHO2_01_FULL_48_10]|uniref:Uncharacterized protein n=1 Tax=Candidatus Kaiserbacteria bacterium RIFCSPHIGHO2_01_FULL_48_10 TaxID=1798476 RepID=A0A1F6C527_9BACT|nr:MAG: hypothetical protein A2841_02820 [Candidatus Kaiserbacteria bacterium RIFCSPHIGHO2_01_FULL_48_10]